MGYKSVHLICKLNNERASLPENEKYRQLAFEIQVRTILQHSWAEIEHDKNYKFSGVLPKEIKRRLMVLSGALELIDREFNQLSKEIDSYANKVKIDTEIGELDTPINSISLEEYLNVKFADLVTEINMEPHFNGADEQILRELKNYGIKTLKDLDNIIPEKFIASMINIYRGLYTNYLGALRDIMIINDIDKYYESSFHYNFTLTPQNFPLFKIFKVDLDRVPIDYISYEEDEDHI